MQVADATAGLSPRVEQGRKLIAARTEHLSASFVSMHVKATLEMPPLREVSPAAALALDYIAGSTQLSRQEKKTLIRLVAVVDTFAHGDPKLMKDIIGIAKIMEAKRPANTYPRHTFEAAMKEYWRQRDRLEGEERDGVVIRVETEITLVRIEAEKTSLVTAEIPSNSAKNG